MNNEEHKIIGLCKSEVNTIINGMGLILSLDKIEKINLSDEARYWYTHVKNLFQSFKESNFK